MDTEDLYPITIEKEIPPDGALEDAAEFRKIAAHFNRMAESMRRKQRKLEQVWEGKAKHDFFDTFNPLPNRLDDFAETLEALAQSIEQKTVTVQETFWVTLSQLR